MIGRQKDHPRVRGEKVKVVKARFMGLGSPPRARGKENKARKWRSQAGITPACAGKRPGPGAADPLSPDHPRVRGEKSATTKDLVTCMGSPPRARGKGPAPCV